MGGGVRWTGWALAGILGVMAAGVTAVSAQRIWSGYYGRTPPRFATPDTFEGSFHFCRILFTSNRREKQGWQTDYPGADINFSVRLAELTKVRVKFVREGDEHVPDAIVVRLTDEALFHCPFTLMEDAGTVRFDDAEVGRLREYLLKGGFLFVSDYHGTWGRGQFDAEIARVLPRSEFPVVDLTPPSTHPIWNMLFRVERLPQLASIQTWRRTGETLERWNEDGAAPDARGIADRHGRLMVVMVHNTDVPDAWEREGENPDYFYQFSPEAYAVAREVVEPGTPALAKLVRDSANLMPFHIVVEGTCWLRMERDERPLAAGDVIAFPFATGHQLGAGVGCDHAAAGHDDRLRRLLQQRDRRLHVGRVRLAGALVDQRPAPRREADNDLAAVARIRSDAQ